MNKKLKVILMVLVMILIILIGFGGIYAKKLAIFNNILPDYELGTNLEGSILTTLVLDDTSEEVIYDAEGNEIDAIPEGEDESAYTKKQVYVNDEESKTAENYKTVKQIMIERLESLGVSNYEVRLDEENGNIAINLENTNITSTVVSQLLQVGKMEIIDTDTKDVLMNNDDIKHVAVLYSQTNSGVVVYLDMEFTNDGRKKLEQISKDYVTVKENNAEENKEKTTQEETEANTEEVAKEKTITMNVDNQEFLSTAFDEPITSGRLTISIGSATTNTDTLNDYILQAQQYAALLDNGKMPLVYTVETSEYIPATFADTQYIYVFIGLIVLLVVISILYMMIRYRKTGIVSSLVYITTIALYLILIRYSRTVISLEFMISAVILILLNTIVNCKVLSKLSKEDAIEERLINLDKEYIKLLDIIIITLIPAIIFTYHTSILPIASIGMALFWGIMCIVLMNGVFTRRLLIASIKNS